MWERIRTRETIGLKMEWINAKIADYVIYLCYMMTIRCYDINNENKLFKCIFNIDSKKRRSQIHRNVVELC